MDITVKTKGVENVKSVIGHYDYFFSYFLLYSYCFYYFTIFSSMWQIALRYFYVQYKLQVIYYANLPYSYYSQYTVIIFSDNSVAGYIALLCISIA